MLKEITAWQTTDGRCFARKEDAVKHEQALRNQKVYRDIRELMDQHFQANVRNPDWREYSIDNAMNAIIDNSQLVAHLLSTYVTEG